MCLAVPGKILSIEGTEPLFRAGKIDFSGVRKQVSLACVPEAVIGDFVLVHAGIAIATIDEKEARAALQELERLGEELP